MRSETNREKLEQFMAAIGRTAKGAGSVYFTGGASSVLYNWRDMTIDIDLKLDPEPPGIFEAIAKLKNELDINIELAAPDQFLPVIPGWRERSVFINQHGKVSFYHYDFYSQALAKIERYNDRDRMDVARMFESKKVIPERLLELFSEIEPALIRFPAIDGETLKRRLKDVCKEYLDA